MKRQAPLNFEYEARLYFERVQKYRHPADTKLIQKFSRQIRLQPSTKTITAIASHIDEPNLHTLLKGYLNQKGGLHSHHIVIFLNAGPRVSRSKFRKGLDRQMTLMRRFQESYTGLHLSVFHHHFASIQMGRVRGLLTDAIALAALNGKISDPILISNDADTLSISNTYLEVIKRNFRDRPLLDALRGHVHWGHENQQFEQSPSTNLRFPEVILAAHYWTSRLKERVNNKKQYHISFTGQNTAMRMAAYCAVGGYDYRLLRSEDSSIGAVLYQMRLGLHGHTKSLKKYIDYDSEATVVVSPRRVFYAVLSEKGFHSQWIGFNRIDGPELDPNVLQKKYQSRKDLLQFSDLDQANHGDPASIRKVKKRVQAVFAAEAGVDKQIESAADMRAIARVYGLAPAAKTTKSHLKINWKKSPIFQRLIRVDEAAFFLEELRRRWGIGFPAFTEKEITKVILGSVAERMRLLNLRSIDDYKRFLNQAPTTDEWVELMEAIGIHKTHFFRYPNQIRKLQNVILPQLFKTLKDREIKAWSAGCSSGAEPYTLAILLNEFLRKKKGFEYSILATDIGSGRLSVAKLGVYKKSIVIHEVPTHLQSKYFESIGKRGRGLCLVKEEIKAPITFKKLNLNLDNGPRASRFDLVTCKNVLCYFNPEDREAVLTKLLKALRPGGFLLISPKEHLDISPTDCRVISPGIFQKF